MSVPEDKQVSPEATSFHLFTCYLLYRQLGVPEMLALSSFVGLYCLNNNHKCVGMKIQHTCVQAQHLISMETQVGALRRSSLGMGRVGRGCLSSQLVPGHGHSHCFLYLL